MASRARRGKRIGVGQGLIGSVTAPQYPAGVQPYTPVTATAPPPDPYLIAQQNAAQRSLALGNAWDTYGRAQIENQYGYGADVSNPFSEAMLLQHDYQANQRGTTNSYASQGQLYSGAYQNAKNYNARQYAIADDAARRRYQSAKDAITRGASERYSQIGANLTQQDLDALIRQIGR